MEACRIDFELTGVEGFVTQYAIDLKIFDIGVFHCSRSLIYFTNVPPNIRIALSAVLYTPAFQEPL